MSSQKSSPSGGVSNKHHLNFPRSREIYLSDPTDYGNAFLLPVKLLSGEELRQSIQRESHERAAEKSRRWSNLALERDQELHERIETQAKEAASGRLNAENLANAQYRLQRHQREQAREKKRQELLTLERSSALASTPPANSLSSFGGENGTETRHETPDIPNKQSLANEAAVAQQENGIQDVIVAHLDELRKTMQALTLRMTSLPIESPTSSDNLREIYRRYKLLYQKAGLLASALASESAPNSSVASDLEKCVTETKSLILLAQSEQNKLLEEADKRRRDEQLAVESELEAIKQATLDTVTPVEAVPVPKEEVVTVSANERAQRLYEFYAQKAKSAKASFVQLESDPALKSLKSAVLFASSNPVVTCSANSAMEIIEPYRKAFLLLRGAEVETNSIRVRLSHHPDIVHYVRYNMAKKFIDLACMQTEEKNEIKLFALATLITEMWSADPTFGETFLALLFSEFPVLLPYYGKASLKLEGNVELQLKRLGALSKFYAAIMQTDRTFLLKRLFPTKTFDGVNPHGVQAGWELLSGLVNQEPQLGTTVLVMRNVLSVAGWLLHRTYQKQFSKLLAHVSRYVLPKIRSTTPKELQGPVERLAELLDVFHRTQTVAVPENRLSEEFWSY
ncbi:putative Nucleoporin GLE1 [Hypsibius exemplaris]|uniref:mRNA export factor GLE1 n=1 Tax=Hypsibius exemplaris TaxID=2072580 RepID=A0A1W0WQK9_HYPEX|nr:putative Nucleoporin GLE1 [Hypsibius exemplaris]